MYKVFFYDKEIILTDKLPSGSAINLPYADIADKKDFRNIIDDYLSKISKGPKSFYLLNSNPDKLLSYLKDYTFYLEAAGGLVRNPPEELLFIYRHGKWDLPKGKKEPGESPETTAVREVEEECGIGDICIISELTPTYHIYNLPSEQWVLKKTYWYLMNAGDWENPAPQIEENISKVVWAKLSDVNCYLENTYASIKMLIEEYLTGLVPTY